MSAMATNDREDSNVYQRHEGGQRTRRLSTNVSNMVSRIHDDALMKRSFSTTLAKADVSFEGALDSEDTVGANLFKFLRRVPHLYLLSGEEMSSLTLLRREYAPTDLVIGKGDHVDHLYIVLQGEVHVFGDSRVSTKRVGRIEAPNIFGFDSIIFGENSNFDFCAGDKKTVLQLIPRREFMRVLEASTPFRQSIGRRMAEHMDLFSVFQDFCRDVLHTNTTGKQYLDMLRILKSYRELQNCIHPLLNVRTIDTGAWSYAVGRLPENVTETFCFDLTRSLPPFMASRMKQIAATGEQMTGSKVTGPKMMSPVGDIQFIKSKARRRCVWQLGKDGKTMVLLRDGFTDILDFITCLCIHITEATKLRYRLQGMVHPPIIDALDDFFHNPSNGPDFTESEAKQREVLNKCTQLSDAERNGLLRLWPKNVLRRIYEILMHREEYMIRVEASVSLRFEADPMHGWALNLRSSVMRLLGLNIQTTMPDDVVIDVLSSNTHGTKNLLSSFTRVHREEILEFARVSKPEILKLHWHNLEDMIYAITPAFLDKNPSKKKDFQDSLLRSGFDVMSDTEMTGLEVDVIPVWKIDLAKVDPALSGGKPAGRKHFILNMDFAFGAQADGIMRALIITFGARIRSVNIMGKAGGLCGKRGDILLASHVLFTKSSLATQDAQDEIRSCDNKDLTAERLRELCGRDVHSGPVLTIPGTMLQNEKLLRYYRTIWKCVGVEMEGSYFCRQVIEGRRAGLLSKQCTMRFAYYTSDLPLASGDHTLSTPMAANEGVPPVYAIIRAMMEKMLCP